MKTPLRFKENLENGIITDQMLEMAIFSFDIRATNSQIQKEKNKYYYANERAYRNKRNKEKYEATERQYTKLRNCLLYLAVTPTSIYKINEINYFHFKVNDNSFLIPINNINKDIAISLITIEIKQSTHNKPIQETKPITSLLSLDFSRKVLNHFKDKFSYQNQKVA